MAENPFKKATKKQALLRMALTGPSGGGKTFTALKLASHLVSDAKIALIDTERGSASKYADLFDFDVLELDDFRPDVYMRAITMAQENGYNVLVIDSLSHAWFGTGGVLSIVDDEAAKMKTSNSYVAWKKGTEVQNKLVDTILAAKMHVIATMRSKMDYVLETNEKGKSVPRKVGLAPIQRDGVEYEFDVVAEMDINNTMLISKSRCPSLSGGVFEKPGKDVAGVLRAWLTDGGAVEDTPERPQATEPSVAPEPSELDAHLGPRPPRGKGAARPEPDTPTHTDELPPAAQDDGADWRTSTAPLTQATWAKFQPWLAHSYTQIGNVNHAAAAVMKALREAGAIPDGDAPDWGAVFGKVTPGEVIAALDAHYALAKAS